MIVLGLTGSIGMGKSTLAAMMTRLGVPAHDSDDAARAAIEPDGPGVASLHAAFPYFEYPQIYGRKTKEGRTINRKKLATLVFADGDKAAQERRKLESIIHPLVRQSQNDFIKHAKRTGRKMVCLDIPLLFETGGEKAVDYTIVVTAPYHIQRQRVLARPGMTPEDFEKRLASQMPDSEKCAKADFVIHTGLNRAHTQKQLKDVLAKIAAAHEMPVLKKGETYDP
jgi:dephospho-CoA kinase